MTNLDITDYLKDHLKWFFQVNSNEWHLDTSAGASGRSKILQFVVYIILLCPSLLKMLLDAVTTILFPDKLSRNVCTEISQLYDLSSSCQIYSIRKRMPSSFAVAKWGDI